MIGIQSTVWGVVGRAKYHFLDRHYIQTVRFVLVTACLLLTVIIGMLLSNTPTLGYVFMGGIVGLCVMLLLYRNMEVGCLMVLVLSTVWNIGIGSGTGTPIMLSLVVLLLLAGLWVFKIFVVDRSFKSIKHAPSAWLVFFFSASVIISLVWSSLYVEATVRQLMGEKMMPRLMTAVVIIISPLATLIFANHIRSIRAIKFFTWWFIIYGGAIVATWFLHIISPRFVTTAGQLPVWTAILAVGQALFNQTLPWYKRLGLFAIAGGWFYVQFVLQRSWLSGWLPLALGMTGMMFFFSRRLFFIALLAVGIYVLANTSIFEETFLDESAVSGSTRMEAWEHIFQIVKDHFLFGTGPTGYYFYLLTSMTTFFQLSHNNYVDMIAQTGVVGFTLYIAVWAVFGWMALKTYMRVPKGGFRHGVAAAVLVSFPVTLVIMMLGDWVIPFTYTQTLGGINYTIWPWLIQGIGMALYFESANLSPEKLKAEGSEPLVVADDQVPVVANEQLPLLIRGNDGSQIGQ